MEIQQPTFTTVVDKMFLFLADVCRQSLLSLDLPLSIDEEIRDILCEGVVLEWNFRQVASGDSSKDACTFYIGQKWIKQY